MEQMDFETTPNAAELPGPPLPTTSEPTSEAPPLRAFANRKAAWQSRKNEDLRVSISEVVRTATQMVEERRVLAASASANAAELQLQLQAQQQQQQASSPASPPPAAASSAYSSSSSRHVLLRSPPLSPPPLRAAPLEPPLTNGTAAQQQQHGQSRRDDAVAAAAGPPSSPPARTSASGQQQQQQQQQLQSQQHRPLVRVVSPTTPGSSSSSTPGAASSAASSPPTGNGGGGGGGSPVAMRRSASSPGGGSSPGDRRSLDSSLDGSSRHHDHHHHNGAHDEPSSSSSHKVSSGGHSPSAAAGPPPVGLSASNGSPGGGGGGGWLADLRKQIPAAPLRAAAAAAAGEQPARQGLGNELLRKAKTHEAFQLVPGSKLGREQLSPHSKMLWLGDIHLGGPQLGEGNFGKVSVADWLGTPVAVKATKDTTDITQEAETLQRLRHPHIISFYGLWQSDTDGVTYMVTEWADLGNCHEFVKNRQLGQPLLLDIAEQIAAGMRFLEHQCICHRDLALRNVLLSTGPRNSVVVKICDFGLAKSVSFGSYIASSNKRIAFRWSAPEVLSFDQVSTAGDVWSYGVCIWELFSQGALPYSDEGPYGELASQQIKDKLVSRLLAGRFLGRPLTCPVELFDYVSTKCWAIEPKDRADFRSVFETCRTLKLAAQKRAEPLSRGDSSVAQGLDPAAKISQITFIENYR